LGSGGFAVFYFTQDGEGELFAGFEIEVGNIFASGFFGVDLDAVAGEFEGSAGFVPGEESLADGGEGLGPPLFGGLEIDCDDGSVAVFRSVEIPEDILGDGEDGVFISFKAEKRVVVVEDEDGHGAVVHAQIDGVVAIRVSGTIGGWFARRNPAGADLRRGFVRC